MKKNKITIDKATHAVTCSGDVVELLVYKADEHSHSFKLCKVSMHYEAENTMWVYMLLVERDAYPIVISKEQAKRILENPQEGAQLVYNCWMQRYR